MFELLASFTYDPVQRWGPVSPHGVGTAVGFIAGALLMARRAEPRGIPRAEVYNAVTWGAFGAVIGARGFYVLAHLDRFDGVLDMLRIWEGGLTMFGGFVGGLVLGLGYLYRKGFHIPTALDAAAPGFVVGVLVGRIGDIIIADHLGRTTDFFLGYEIPDADLAPGYGPPHFNPGDVVHHTAVYDFAGALLLLGFLYLLERRRRLMGAGSLFAVFAIWYGLQRLVVDFTRNTEVIDSFFFGLSGSQWAGIAFAVAGAAFLLRRHRRAAHEPLTEAAVAVGAEQPSAAEASAATGPTASEATPPPPPRAPERPATPEPPPPAADPAKPTPAPAEPTPAEPTPAPTEPRPAPAEPRPAPTTEDPVGEFPPPSPYDPSPEPPSEPPRPSEPS